MGHPFVKTPNLDRLMRQSVRFRNAYIAEPVCAPSRVSYFTGMHERVHGLLMGEYGMGGKALLYDLASKIPCLIYDPRVPDEFRGRQLDHLVSSLDYARTILDYAGVEAPEFMDGQSLRPLVEGRDAPWREALFLESLFTGRDNPFQEGIRLGKWKYIRMYDGKADYREADVDFAGRKPEFEMLFDLEADPGERNNLIESLADSDILAALRRDRRRERRRDEMGRACRGSATAATRPLTPT